MTRMAADLGKGEVERVEETIKTDDWFRVIENFVDWMGDEENLLGTCEKSSESFATP